MEKRGLGKGLSALLAASMAEEEEGILRDLPVEQIRPNPYQPRQAFDPEKMAELVASVREHGILQPVLVRRISDEEYALVAGERRLRAAQEVGLLTIPALVKEYTDPQMLEIALIENVQREDINPVEAARAYQRLNTEFGLTQQEIAQRVGKSQPSIANTLRLLNLPEPILESLQRGEITEGHAMALLQVTSDNQITIWENIRQGSLSVREALRIAREKRPRQPVQPTSAPDPPSAPARDPNYLAVEEALQISLGTKVRIRSTGRGGKIEIEFFSSEELEGIVEKILGGGQREG
jgi:ParB family chromosome partitioning protein